MSTVALLDKITRPFGDIPHRNRMHSPVRGEASVLCNHRDSPHQAKSSLVEMRRRVSAAGTELGTV